MTKDKDAPKDKDDPIKGELVEEVATAVEAEAADETPQHLLVPYDDTFTAKVPPSFDHMSIDALEAFAELTAASEEGDQSIATFRHIAAFLEGLLGAAQWRRFKRGRDGKEANELVKKIMAAYGEAAAGE